MAEKIVLQTPRRFTNQYTLPACQAVELGVYREAALVLQVSANTYANTVFRLECAHEPLEGAFSSLPQPVSSITLSVGPGVYFLYLRRVSRYLRYALWRSGGLITELSAELWLKKRI